MNILMCADGSKNSENALDFGGIIANCVNAKVTILHIIENPKKDSSKEILKRAKEIVKSKDVCGDDTPGNSRDDTDKNSKKSMGKNSKKKADKNSKKNKTGNPIDIKIKTRKGKPEVKIIHEANNGDYDMVVLGSHGIKGIKSFFFGDVAYRVIEHVKIPVLVVRKKRKSISKILMCTGGSKYAEEAIQFGGKIAKAMDAKVCVLHATPNPPLMFTGLGMDESLEEFLKTDTTEAKYLKMGARILQEKGIDTDVELRHGLPPDEILDQAEEGNYDMIVMGSHGMCGIRRFLLGNVAYSVVKHTTLPCLLVKPKRIRFLSSFDEY